MFNFNGNFKKAQKHLFDQANKAMFSLIAKARRLSLPIDIQLDLFRSLVQPILTYGCEIWGFENCQLAEKLQLRFCKLLLKCKTSTTTCMVLGELGQFPIINHIKSRILNYWAKIINTNDHRLSKILYKLLHTCHTENNKISAWINNIEYILCNIGYNYNWISQSANQKCFKHNVKSRIQDQFLQNWNSLVNNSSSCTNYRTFKKDFKLESYLLLLPTNHAINLSRFRLSNTNIPVVTGRYFNTIYDDRTCNLCSDNIIGDEFHYIFECSYFQIHRKKFIDHKFISCYSLNKMYDLFNSIDKKQILGLSKFTEEINQKFRLP